MNSSMSATESVRRRAPNVFEVHAEDVVDGDVGIESSVQERYGSLDEGKDQIIEIKRDHCLVSHTTAALSVTRHHSHDITDALHFL